MKKFLLLLCSCILAIAIIAAGITTWQFQGDTEALSLDLSGAQELYLEYGNSYSEPGVLAQFTGGDTVTEVPVSTLGQVDDQKLGVYLIKYTAQLGDMVCTNYRRIHVVDTAAPTITLTVDPDAYTLLGETYQEEGFAAVDNYDGNLTDHVIRTETDGVVTYTVTDSSGNTATVTRTIHYIDPSAPTLQLEGAPISFILTGENYVEPGFTATDEYDGDLTEAVTVTGAVDPNIPGIYSVVYSVSNHYGRTVTRERTVYVVPRNEDSQPLPDDPSQELPTTGGTAIESNGKTIYLTFDDGPGKHTERLLDVLKKYGIKASFFVVNSNSSMDMIARAAQEGHTVAIHTYTHSYEKIYASDEAFFADLQAMQNVIHQYTGQATMLTRFPGGSSNTISSLYNRGIMSRLTKELEAKGFQYFDWNVDSKDAGGAKTAEEVFKNVISGIGNRRNSVVLQHDTKGFSVDAVEHIIAWGLCNGYTFKALDSGSPTCHHGVNN